MRDSLTSLPALGGCVLCFFFFFFNDTATTEIYTLSLHDALPISSRFPLTPCPSHGIRSQEVAMRENSVRSEEHTSELQSRLHLVCRLLLEKKNKTKEPTAPPSRQPLRVSHA